MVGVADTPNKRHRCLCRYWHVCACVYVHIPPFSPGQTIIACGLGRQHNAGYNRLSAANQLRSSGRRRLPRGTVCVFPNQMYPLAHYMLVSHTHTCERQHRGAHIPARPARPGCCHKIRTASARAQTQKFCWRIKCAVCAPAPAALRARQRQRKVHFSPCGRALSA